MRATVYEVRKAGSRVKVILSRTKPQLVQRLFEQEIPEISEGVIEIRSIAREPGYRTKVAVSSMDQRVDCVGACVGVRGNRIKNIVDELSGERIDIVRWSDDRQVLIPNALQPAEVEEVILCQMLGRAIVLVREDQLSLAIGKRGQNVRLASKLCGWDIEIMTRDELDEQIERAVTGFSSLEGVESELAEKLVGEGFLSYDDLSVIEPDALMEMGGLGEEQAEVIVKQAEAKAEEAEKAAAEQRRQRREQDRAEKSAGPSEEDGRRREPGERADWRRKRSWRLTCLETDVALQTEDEPSGGCRRADCRALRGQQRPIPVAEDVSPTDPSGDGNHRETHLSTASPSERPVLPIRIYALAKELQIDNKKLVDICTRAGITGKGSALASLTDEEVVRLKAFMAGGQRGAVGGKADGACCRKNGRCRRRRNRPQHSPRRLHCPHGRHPRFPCCLPSTTNRRGRPKGRGRSPRKPLHPCRQPPSRAGPHGGAAAVLHGSRRLPPRKRHACTGKSGSRRRQKDAVRREVSAGARGLKRPLPRRLPRPRCRP